MLQHVGLVCYSEEKADLFFKDILGLEKGEKKFLDEDLAEKIFFIKTSFEIINYTDASSRFEVLIPEDGSVANPEKPVAHLCIKVDNMDEFLVKCKDMGVSVNRVPKGDRFLVFVTDFSNNIFEVQV